MSGGLALRRSRRRSGALLLVPLASLLILVVGWSVLWAVARQQALSGLDRLLASEVAHGRTWSCPDRAVTGFPFRIALACHDVTFAGRVDGADAQGHLAGLSAEAWIYEPSAVALVMTGPLTLTTADGRADFSLAWTSLSATLRGLVGGVKRLEVLADDPVLTRPQGGGGMARHVELRAGPAPALGEDAEAVDAVISGGAVPLLDAVTGEGATIDGLVSGVVTRAFGDLPDLGLATVERWRRSGGRLDVSKLTATKGPLSAGASGTLALDDLHRVTGQLTASLGGFDPLAKRFGIPLRAVEVGGLLASLLGKAPASAEAATPPGTVTLPITFAAGSLAVGPFKTGLRLSPLY